MYKAKDVAQFIITSCLDNGTPISGLSLNRTLYFLQEYHLKTYGIRLISDDFFATQNGPVISSVYFTYAAYGANPIYSRYPIPNKWITQDDAEMILNVSYNITNGNPWDEYHKIFNGKDSVWRKVISNIGYDVVILPEYILHPEHIRPRTDAILVEERSNNMINKKYIAKIEVNYGPINRDISEMIDAYLFPKGWHFDEVSKHTNTTIYHKIFNDPDIMKAEVHDTEVILQYKIEEALKENAEEHEIE